MDFLTWYFVFFGIGAGIALLFLVFGFAGAAVYGVAGWLKDLRVALREANEKSKADVAAFERRRAERRAAKEAAEAKSE